MLNGFILLPLLFLNVYHVNALFFHTSEITDSIVYVTGITLNITNIPQSTNLYFTLKMEGSNDKQYAVKPLAVGPNTIKFEDTYFELKNLHSDTVFNSTAVIYLVTPNYNFSTTDFFLFDISAISYNKTGGEPQAMLNEGSFNNFNYSLQYTYQKTCDNADIYGYTCNVSCPKWPPLNYCWTCNEITGEVLCCDGNYDPNSCFNLTAATSVTAKPGPCEPGTGSESDYDHQKTLKKRYFWAMIALAILSLILLILLLVFCCCCCHYRSEAQKLRKVTDVKQENVRPQTLSIVHPHLNQPNDTITRRRPLPPYRPPQSEYVLRSPTTMPTTPQTTFPRTSPHYSRPNVARYSTDTDFEDDFDDEHHVEHVV
uniref:DSL domain-containing protein n=1 Tax=Panagrellus redivivus TaxID=6233 RepID=A0A7E4V609_PANRE